jgi:hypothetical protein
VQFSATSFPSTSTTLLYASARSDVFFDLRGLAPGNVDGRVRCRPHDVFDAVVPAAVEDHDLALPEIAQCNAAQTSAFSRDPREPEAQPRETRVGYALGDGLDRSALAGRVAAFEQNDDSRSRFFDPILRVVEI